MFKMRRLLLAAALAAATLPALAADVGVSVRIGDPNFYGRIDVGDAPRPYLLYPEPVVIQRPSTVVVHEPVYLRVPPGHAKHWEKHCYRYQACGQPVYFVQDRWYNDVYVPHYREHHGQWDHHERGHDGDHDRDHGRGR